MSLVCSCHAGLQLPLNSQTWSDCVQPAFVSLEIIIRVCPHVGLLSLSVKGAEVASLTMNVIQSIPNLDWLSVWIKAYAFVHTGDNTRAINTIW